MFCLVRCLIVLSSIVCGHLLVKRKIFVLLSLLCGLCIVCHKLFALPFGVIDRLCSVNLALPRHLQYYLYVKYISNGK